MKKLIAAALLALIAALYIGYYTALEDGDVETVLFIKKHPTFQIEFYNIHANDGDLHKLERLSPEQRKWITDYCRYRLGIDTDLTTQADVEMCSKS